MGKTAPARIASLGPPPPPPPLVVAAATVLLVMLLPTIPLAKATTSRHRCRSGIGTGTPSFVVVVSPSPNARGLLGRRRDVGIGSHFRDVSAVVGAEPRSGGGASTVGVRAMAVAPGSGGERGAPPLRHDPSTFGRRGGHRRMRRGDARLRAAAEGDGGDGGDGGGEARGDGAGEPPAKEEPDLFDYFDPRISPHMYPGGIPDASSSTTTGGPNINGGENEGDAASSSAPGGGARALRSTVTPGTGGAAGGVVERIGVLLVDHGSRREASNLHLETIAAAYQSSPRCPPHFVVGAAHMEIAGPSIEDGMRDLISRGASRIVCHPYFLSPGRHATEDVPRLIDEALDSIRADGADDPSEHVVEVVTTDPIGSSVNALVAAIGDVVEEVVKGGGFRPKDDGLGFFGDIMRQMEEME